MSIAYSKLIRPGSFEPEQHYYPQALNSTIHPTVEFFFSLKQDYIILRYCHLHPHIKYSALQKLLNYQPKYFRWAGADLIHATTKGGNRKMVIIENNSCPSGQKSMPMLGCNYEQGGYRILMEQTFKHVLMQKGGLRGGLAVIYDKNNMEASGYAAALADIMKEPVHFVPFYEKDTNSTVQFDKKRVMHILGHDNKWHSIRSTFRYLTQCPWNRLPIQSKTLIVNPIIVCLAGGRNKNMAAKAYDIFNKQIASTGLQIQTPETIRNVRKEEIPLLVKNMGGQAVIKVPYSNAGQGVFTVINNAELEAFMLQDFPYQLFIVQGLIGNHQWGNQGEFYHIGTLPNSCGESYATDLRIMVCATQKGIRPICMYSRRAKQPLADIVSGYDSSWGMLGTNLSIRRNDNTWDTDTTRLILMDREAFNKLDLSIDDLIEGYIQTVLSMIAIDRMAQKLVNTKGGLRNKLFKTLNNEEALLQEIIK